MSVKRAGYPEISRPIFLLPGSVAVRRWRVGYGGDGASDALTHQIDVCHEIDDRGAPGAPDWKAAAEQDRHGYIGDDHVWHHRGCRAQRVGRLTQRDGESLNFQRVCRVGPNRTLSPRHEHQHRAHGGIGGTPSSPVPRAAVLTGPSLAPRHITALTKRRPPRALTAQRHLRRFIGVRPSVCGHGGNHLDSTTCATRAQFAHARTPRHFRHFSIAGKNRPIEVSPQRRGSPRLSRLRRADASDRARPFGVATK